MNRKQIILVAVVPLVGGAIFLWSHHQRAEAEASQEEQAPSVVTVQVGPLRRATLHGYVVGYGIVQPAPAYGSAPAATARVAAPVAGVVARVAASEGMQVKAGTLLVELEDQGPRAAVTGAQQVADRQAKLYAENNTSQRNLQEAQAQLAAAQAQLALYQIRAPLSGTIMHLNVRPGEAVDLTSVVAEISDLGRLVVSVDIPSGEAGRLKLGDPVEIGGAKPVSSALDYVSPAVEAASDTVNVRAPLPANCGISSGTMVPVRIAAEEHANCIAAPAASVVTNDQGESVVSIVKDGEATQVPVHVGLHDGSLVEVAGAGLSPGDNVVVVGAYGLPEKTKVRVEDPNAAAH
jgi:membrane fusion protein (multidrug efflux system)